MAKGKIKTPSPVQGERVGVSKSADEKPFNIQHPVFCFKHLHPHHHLDACTPDEKIAFVERLVKLSQLSWNQIRISHRHGFGTEKIALSSLKTPIPYALTEDVTFVLAFRFNGFAPFVGHLNRFIFHIIFIDRDFTLYQH